MSAPTFTPEEVREAAKWQQSRYTFWSQWNGGPRPSETLGQIIDQHATPADMLDAYAALLEQQAQPCKYCGSTDGKHR